MSPPPTATDHQLPVLGRDMGTVGRVTRALVGGWLVLASVRVLVETPRLGPSDVAVAAGTVLALTVLYTALVRVLGDRVLTRLNPWTGTSMLLTPVVVLALAMTVVDVPRGLVAGSFAYGGVSLLLVSVTGYGGCEVVGIPAALLRRRYTVFCPLNVVDAVEHPLRHARPLPEKVAAVLAALAGIYYFLLNGVLDTAGVDPPVDPRWGVVLLLPAVVVLALRAAGGIRETGWPAMTKEARSHGIGALALTATAIGLLAFGDILFAAMVLLLVIYAGGVVAGVRQLRTH